MLRRKYSEWTLEPKSIQSQRQQLASLLETFHIYPNASMMGSMPYIREQMISRNLPFGKFPYPTIYPSSFEMNLPIASTNWVRMEPYWSYTGFTSTPPTSMFSYYIGVIVVDVTTNPKQPTVKSSIMLTCTSTTETAITMETVIPRPNGASILYIPVDNDILTTYIKSEPVFTLGVDELFVSMAFCRDPCPLNNTVAVFSYYASPEDVLKPQLG